MSQGRQEPLIKLRSAIMGRRRKEKDGAGGVWKMGENVGRGRQQRKRIRHACQMDSNVTKNHQQNSIKRSKIKGHKGLWLLQLFLLHQILFNNQEPFLEAQTSIFVHYEMREMHVRDLNKLFILVELHFQCFMKIGLVPNYKNIGICTLFYFWHYFSLTTTT